MHVIVLRLVNAVSNGSRALHALSMRWHLVILHILLLVTGTCVVQVGAIVTLGASTFQPEGARDGDLGRWLWVVERTPRFGAVGVKAALLVLHL